VVSQKLIALGEKARPVCMGEWLMRTASSIVNKTVDRKTDQSYFVRSVRGRYAANFGTGARGGAEVVAHVLNALLHEHDSRFVCLSDDGKNAFNATDRVNACNTTTRQNPSTHRWVNWLYGNPAMLMIEGVAGCLWGVEGVFQGDPMAGRIHDTAMQKPLIESVNRTAIRFPSLKIHAIAFRDDAYFLGHTQAVLFCHEQFKALRLEHTNVGTAHDKVFAYVSDRACPTDRGETMSLDRAVTNAQEAVNVDHVQDAVVTDGFKAVGSPVSITPTFINDFLTKAFEKYPNFIPRVKKMNIKSALPLLRTTFLPIPTHLIRTTHPDYIRLHARAFDDVVFDTYKHISQDTVTQRHDNNFSAPHELGGLGFRSVEKSSPVAYFASVMNAMHVLRDADVCLKQLCAHYKDPPAIPDNPLPDYIGRLMVGGLPGLLLEAWAVARREVFDKVPNVTFPKTAEQLFRMLASESTPVDKLQHSLMEDVEIEWAEQAKVGMEKEVVARTQANAIRGAASLFSSAPTSAMLMMNDADFRFHLQARVGAYLVPNFRCVCGECVMTVDHIVSCKKLRGRFIRHDVVVALVCNFFKAAGMVARTEVRVVNGTQKRMDVVVYTATHNIWIDVSIVNPLAPSYVDKADPIAIREKHKNGKWNKHAVAAGVKFYPFVLNVTGGLGVSALNLLQQIASQGLTHYPYAPAVKAGKWMAKYKANLTQRISVALAHITHISIQEAVCMAQGRIPKKMYRGVYKYASVVGVF
jgi:hypothetical protein